MICQEAWNTSARLYHGNSQSSYRSRQSGHNIDGHYSKTKQYKHRFCREIYEFTFDLIKILIERRKPKQKRLIQFMNFNLQSIPILSFHLAFWNPLWFNKEKKDGG